LVITEILAKQMYNLMLLKSAVDAGSISRASSELGVSQPTITRGIARLEAALGYQLIERNAKGVVSTEVCRNLLKHVERAAGQLAEAGATLRRMRRSRYRSLACGGSPTAMESYVPSVMFELIRRYPNLSLQLYEASSPALLKSIHAGELDIAIGARLEVEEGLQVKVEPLVADMQGVFVNARHPLLGKPQAMKDLLATQSWVFPEPLWSYPATMLLDTPLASIPCLVRAQSISAIRWYARETDFLTISSTLMLHTELSSGLVAELTTDWSFPRSQHVIYYRSPPDDERPVDIAVALFKASQWRLDGKTETGAS
jgi:LysR family transcriptional regulator, pca operon transcriptional activator